MQNKEEEKKVEEHPAPEVGKLKRGDYMIHVFIEQAKNIRLEGEDTVDPMIEVICMNNKKYSSTKNDIGPTSIVQWSEHIFFEQKHLEPDDVEGGKISIRIMNKGFFKEDSIGLYEFDLTQIYYMKSHALFHQWLALSNPEGKDFNEITAYIKLSISIAGPGDEQVQLSEEEGGVESTDTAVILMPSSIKKQYKQLFFRIFKAEKLPQMDRFGTIDAYIETTFFKQSLKTSVVTMKDNLVTWDQEMLLPIQWPVASNRLVFKLYDYDSAGSDELVGSMIFSIKDIILAQGQTFKWINLYGAPLGYSGDNCNKMNNNPEYASTWKGRLLLQYVAEDTKHPEMKIQPVQNLVKQDAAKWSSQTLTEYEIMAEVGCGICLPDTKKYKVMICINDFQFQTDTPLETKENYCRWNKRFDMQKLLCVYPSVEELDRVCVYLLDGDKPICYWRGNAKQFENPDPAFQWLPFSCDLAVGVVTEQHKAGMFQFKISINNKTKNGPMDFKQFDAWKKPPPKRLSSWKIRCFIYQCKDLPAADSEGTSDPFVEVWTTDKNKSKTPVVEDNCNPIFFSTLEVYYDFTMPSEAPPIVLNIWDKDEGILDNDDFIGRAVVFLKDASFSEDDTIPEPKWHKVTMGFGQNEASIGEILVSFSLVPDDYRFKVPTEYMNLTEYLDFKEYNIEINVLGLRQLQSVGLLPVKKPFVKFNLRSLLPPEKAKAIQNVSTNPSDTGPNANINTMISFTMHLPSASLFCPKLSCDVFDMIFKGFVQPLLGTFSIPIGDVLQETIQNQKDELEQSDHIIKELKKIIAGGGVALNLRNSIEAEERKSIFGQNGFEEEAKADLNKIDIQFISEESQKQIEKLGNSAVKKSIRKVAGKGGIFKHENNALQDMMAGNVRGKFFKVKAENEITQKKELDLQRSKDMEDMKKTGHKTHKNIVLPVYAFDERLKIKREVDPPPASLFLGLGFNKSAEESKKHYRRYYPDELENVKEVIPKKPFHECIVRRGQQRGASKGFMSMFSRAETDDTGQVTTIKEVGKFKGIIKVYNNDESENFKSQKKSRNELIKKLIRDLHQKKLNEPMAFDFDKLETAEARGKFTQLMEKIGCADLQLSTYLLETSYEEMIGKMMLSKTTCLMRVYFVEGFDFAQRDIGSFSDPYLKISCGKKEYSDRDNYQLDNPNPKFHKHFDFTVEFPGASPLVIQAYDYDDLFGDDLIGETVVDLDDRFFSPEWQSIKEKPVEYRQLRHASSTVSQGVIKMWVEIMPTSKSTSEDKIWDIIPRPQKEYEIRLVIWDTKDVICADAEGTSDVYIRAFFDTKDAKETDCHYRCQNGKASFNWRLLFKQKAPSTHYNLTLQAWDRDFFKSNDLIGDANFDLKHIFDDVIETGKQIALNKNYYQTYLQGVLPADCKIVFEDDDSFWIPCKGIDEKTKQVKENGQVRISITVLPIELAEGAKVGEARTEPNHSPFLPQPTGRISLTLNPFAMLNQMVGPEVRRKIYGICCLTVCLALIVAMFPMIFSNLISNAILKAF